MHSGKELRCQTNNINADTTGLGKAFAECGTRQRPLGKETAGLLSGTRQSLCRGTRQRKTLGKQKNSRKITKWFLKIGKTFAECGTRQRPLGKAFAGALGKEKHSANKKF